MKKILFITLVFFLSAAFALAQFPGESFKQVTGVVKSLEKGSSPRIVVTDDDGEELTLVIDPEATYYDVEFYPVTLEAVRVAARVNIRYDADNSGVNTANWFNILE